MKRWYQWFYLSLAFASGGVINYLDGRQIVAAVIQVSITATLAMIQFLCDQKGEKGRKVFNYISIAVIVLLIISMIYTLLHTFG